MLDGYLDRFLRKLASLYSPPPFTDGFSFVFLYVGMARFISIKYLASLFLLPIAALANEEAVRHETVLVTAPKYALDEIDADYHTGQVTVIQREQFSGDVATVADVLKQEVSVQIRQLGGLGSFSTVNLRGASSSQVNVYLDGVLLNGAYGGTVDLSQFLLSSVEQIEVYRSHVPLQLGPSNIGGAIHIRTRKGMGGLGETSGAAHNQFSVSYGSFETQKTSLTLGDLFGDGSTLFSAEYLTSDNDFRFLDDNETPLNLTDDTEERRRNADVDQLGLLMSGIWDLNEKFQLQSNLQYSDKISGLPVSSNDPAANASFASELALLKLKLNYWYQKGFSLSYQLAVSKKEDLFDDEEGIVDVDRDKEETITDSFELASSLSAILGDHVLNLHLEATREQVSSDDLLSADGTGDFDRSAIMIGLQDEWVNSDGSLTLTLGSRFNYVDDQYSYRDDALDLVSETDESWYSSFHSGLLWQPATARNWVHRVNLARDIRVPELDEKFGDRGFSQGNEELVEEKAINFDLGTKYSVKGLSLGATYFFRDLDDGIVLNYNSRGVGEALNIGAARVQGLELELFYQFNPAWSVVFNSTSQLSENLSENDARNGNTLPGLYEFAAYLAPTYQFNQFTFTAAYNYQSGGNYDTAAARPMVDINQVDLTASWQQAGTSIELNFENIGDQRIEYFSRFPGPGRRMYITYKQQF